jgi:DnaJ-class molecular chaperone
MFSSVRSIEFLKTSFKSLNINVFVMLSLPALRYHPDMSAAKRVGFNAAETAGKFREVSEAWQILSKPEVRQKYDGARRRLLGPASSSTIGGIPSEVPTSFNTHKTNFVNVQKAASSNWRDIQDKYKSEKWQKLPLKDRKVCSCT